MDTSNQEVPNSLRNWLVFHFYVDYAFLGMYLLSRWKKFGRIAITGFVDQK